MKIFSKNHFAFLAKLEGSLELAGNSQKAGQEIEKYLTVFREALGKKDPTYLSMSKGYDWCCAYVYYLLKKAGYKINVTPLKDSLDMLGGVKTWYQWALQENKWRESTYIPHPGDLVIFDRLIEEVELDHIGVVLESSSKFIITSEGNYYNKSGIFKRNKDSKIRGYICL